MDQMVDMARTPEDMARAMMPGLPAGPSQYPGGLSICLTQAELAKLGLAPDCQVGDMLHLFAMAKVTSVSSNASESSQDCRIELQITHLAVENEDEENAEMDATEGKTATRAKKRYPSADAANDDAEEEAEA